MMILYNDKNSSFASQFTSDVHIKIENICFNALRLDNERSIVPIRKINIIFYLYMRKLFGNKAIPGPDQGYE
jgi:hypothetical protein